MILKRILSELKLRDNGVSRACIHSLCFMDTEASSAAIYGVSELSGTRRISVRVPSYREFPSYGSPNYRELTAMRRVRV